jgi:hypothetical protein
VIKPGSGGLYRATGKVLDEATEYRAAGAAINRKSIDLTSTLRKVAYIPWSACWTPCPAKGAL